MNSYSQIPIIVYKKHQREFTLTPTMRLQIRINQPHQLLSNFRDIRGHLDTTFIEVGVQGEQGKISVLR
ncbi:MAG TPA: hypothetical protein VJC18_05320 [bacterium]|nr:hypothetical protein [bacterium]